MSHPSMPDQRSGLPKWVIVIGVIGVLAVIGAVIKPDKSDETTGANSASEGRVEALRVTWNGMSASTQHDVCASVNLQGADVTADQIQDAAGELSGAAHADIVWFLEELACA